MGRFLSLESSPVWRRIHWLLFAAALPVSLFGVTMSVVLVGKALGGSGVSMLQLRLIVSMGLAATAAPFFLWAGRQLRLQTASAGSWFLIGLPVGIAILALPHTETLEGFLLPLSLGQVVAVVAAWSERPIRRSVIAAGVASAILLTACLYGQAWGRGALVRAVEGGDMQTTDLLLEFGVGPELEDGEPWPLLEAVERLDLEMVRLLVSYGATPYAEDRSEVSPMMRSIELGFAEATLLFLGAEAARVDEDPASNDGFEEEPRRVATL